ncbi:DUF4202 domain-containing protein [Halomonas sp. PAMB 3264]|uniref:DUF4202 domain-containing protein n=1 Tax=Halomonas sp. PAMB 3264 TaxID=3075222 RepID=UPI002898C870|nr:DUF4202 domain-containing protein [Halomonas sp. PAMB 3264]WNL41180.1 DUF4202 domain-containing protein [Halomonas sp. PAMB 3264]
MSTAFDQTLQAIDALHGEDPRHVEAPGGESTPQELAYAERMTHWLFALESAPAELLQLAVRAQHLQRWKVPRSDYPEGRVGYLTWRRDQGLRAGETVAEIMTRVGFDDEDAKRVADMIAKKGLGRDPNVQTLEDCACLVFLENHFAAFATKIEHDHMVRIVQKTWRKMSEQAHTLALSLPMTPGSAAIVEQALAAP